MKDILCSFASHVSNVITVYCVFYLYNNAFVSSNVSRMTTSVNLSNLSYNYN